MDFLNRSYDSKVNEALLSFLFRPIAIHLFSFPTTPKLSLLTQLLVMAVTETGNQPVFLQDGFMNWRAFVISSAKEQRYSFYSSISFHELSR